MMRALTDVGLAASVVREDRVHEIPEGVSTEAAGPSRTSGWHVRYYKEGLPCEKYRGENWRIRGCPEDD